MHVSRAKMLGAGTALAAFGPALLGPFIVAAEAADAGDIQILQTAISLEAAGIKAYSDAAGLNILTPDVLAVAKGFLADHQAHKDALSAAVKAAGGTPTTDVFKIDYPSLKTQADILNFAEVVERKAAATYLSVIPSFKDPKLAQTAGAILGVETTHVAILNYVLTKSTEAYPKSFVS